jgi:N-acetylglucosaminyl-diphospho-decaprenol L-rhamnosyltransferase
VTSSVAVAIVNFNTRDHLRACLDSVLAEQPDGVVVVDNASTDGSGDLVRSRYPGVTLRVNPTNRGYGAAANQAIRSCGGDYVLLLNGDARVVPGTLAALADHMDRHPRAVVVGPLLQRLDGSVERSYFPFPGSMSWLLENEPIVWLLPYLPVPRERFLCLTSATTARVVPWVKGAALLIRQASFEAVGGFDESYFMYFEEVDLCLRLRARGGEVHFTPAATVIHAGGASTSQVRRAMHVAHFTSALQFYRRHYSAPRRIFWISAMRLKTLLRLVRDLGRLALESDSDRRAGLKEQVAAWLIALRHAPSPPPLAPKR